MGRDTVDKVVRSYFACVTREPFEYKGVKYAPKPLRVSPLLLRGYTCPPGCGGCCLKFTLDYLPKEKRPPGCVERLVWFDGKAVKLYTDAQEANQLNTCRHLNRDDGRCEVYTTRPFSCDFELTRFLTSEEPDKPNSLLTKLYGRGWNMLRVVDQERGALCEMTPVTEESTRDVVRKLKRLKDWTDHFGLTRTWIPTIVREIETHGLKAPLLLSDDAFDNGFGFNPWRDR